MLRNSVLWVALETMHDSKCRQNSPCPHHAVFAYDVSLKELVPMQVFASAGRLGDGIEVALTSLGYSPLPPAAPESSSRPKPALKRSNAFL